jgi:hypothetical protein
MPKTTRLATLTALAVPLALIACSQPQETIEVVQAGPTGMAEVCAVQAAEATGMAVGEIDVQQVAATKTGDTIYDVVAGDAVYSCTVAPDYTIIQFGPA